MLTNKNILIGITGSIAAYKTCELIRLLKKAGANVRVILTRSGRDFITPLTLQALSTEPVSQSLLDADEEAAMGHIALARWADLFLIAPASANAIARIAMGMADDLLSTVALTTTAPIAIAPAMNKHMWENTATQQHIQTLRQRTVTIWGPDTGEQACGDVGDGRLLEAQALFNHCEQFFLQGKLNRCTVLITAGPTQEAIDPVRYISNHSSGKMGFALATAAAQAGATVILVTGPVHQPLPNDIKTILVTTAQEMHDTVHQHITQCDMFIGAAAVSDYRVCAPASEKIKKDTQILNLSLSPTPDILKSISALKRRPFVVGFAAETEQLIKHATQKLTAKQLDMIVANEVGEQKGFHSDKNAVVVINRQGDQYAFEHQPKTQLAVKLIDLITDHYLASVNS